MLQINTNESSSNKQFRSFPTLNIENDFDIFINYSLEQEINVDDFLAVNDKSHGFNLNNQTCSLTHEKFPHDGKYKSQFENSYNQSPFQTEFVKYLEQTADECTSINIEDLLVNDLTFENQNFDQETESQAAQLNIKTDRVIQLIATNQIDKSNTDLCHKTSESKQRGSGAKQGYQNDWNSTNCTMKRHQKLMQQQLILEQQFQLNNNWSKAQMKEIGKEVGLTFKQTYKWVWDRRLKEERQLIRSLKTSKTYYGKMFEISKPQEQITGSTTQPLIFKVIKSRK
eukprot:403359306